MSRALEPDPRRDVVLDATTLKALTHPLRPRILSALRLHGPATASRLAAHLGVNTGATSYHVRQLAEAGFVVEATEMGNARDRWWRAAHARTYFDTHDADQRDLRGLPVRRRRGLRRQRPAGHRRDRDPPARVGGRRHLQQLHAAAHARGGRRRSSPSSPRSSAATGRTRAPTDAPEDARPVSVNLEVFLAPGMSHGVSAAPAPAPAQSLRHARGLGRVDRGHPRRDDRAARGSSSPRPGHRPTPASCSPPRWRPTSSPRPWADPLVDRYGPRLISVVGDLAQRRLPRPHPDPVCRGAALAPRPAPAAAGPRRPGGRGPRARATAPATR